MKKNNYFKVCFITQKKGTFEVCKVIETFHFDDTSENSTQLAYRFAKAYLEHRWKGNLEDVKGTSSGYCPWRLKLWQPIMGFNKRTYRLVT